MEPEKILDIPNDARRTFQVMLDGGVAIDGNALQRVFSAKQRQPHKKHAMIGSYALHREHILPPREAGMVKLLTVDPNLPLGVAAPFA